MRCTGEVADSLREIHHPATFCVDRPTLVSELSDSSSHADIISQCLAMQFRIAPAEVQHIHIGQDLIAHGRKPHQFGPLCFKQLKIVGVVKTKCWILRHTDSYCPTLVPYH